jgi:hypothetical protein
MNRLGSPLRKNCTLCGVPSMRKPRRECKHCGSAVCSVCGETCCSTKMDKSEDRALRMMIAGRFEEAAQLLHRMWLRSERQRASARVPEPTPAKAALRYKARYAGRSSS